MSAVQLLLLNVHFKVRPHFTGLVIRPPIQTSRCYDVCISVIWPYNIGRELKCMSNLSCGSCKDVHVSYVYIACYCVGLDLWRLREDKLIFQHLFVGLLFLLKLSGLYSDVYVCL